MYIPESFRETDSAKLCEFIQQNSFGMLISQVGGEPFASHLPFLIEKQGDRLDALVGHVARANRQWEALEGQGVLVVFPGPHTYISPTWYAEENVVPTWNYVAVHAYGTAHLVEDPADVARMVGEFVKFYEASMPRPWSFDESSQFATRLLATIVGFRISISRVEGKWKLNQNHSQERRERVVRALADQPDENSQAIASLMRENL